MPNITDNPTQLVAGVAEETAYVFPASFSQRRLWFLQQLEPGQTSYLVPMAWKLSGSLDAGAIAFALNRVVERHDTLRTSFSVEAGEPVQVVNPHREFAVELLDFTGDPAAAQAEALLEANTPFDLATDRMFRAKLLRLGTDEHLLLATTHHIAFDGWSRGVFTREFLAFYREAVTGEPAAVPELQIQYGDFAAWQQEHLSGERLEHELGFWTNALEGAPTLLDLPKDRPRTQEVSADGAVIAFALDEELSASLRALAQQTGSTLFMVMLTALYVLLARYSGQDDLLVGTPIANRERLELEPLIGFFVNTLVLRGRVHAGDTFLDLLAAVKRTTLDAYSHQEMPFEKLVETLAPERSLSYNPLFQVMFALHNTPREPATLPELKVTPAGGGRLKTKLDLFLSVVDGKSALRGSLEYSLALFDGVTVERLLDHYKTLLRRMAEVPEAEALAVPFLGEDEAQRLLTEWNRTEAEYPRDSSVQELFAQQVARTPDNPAVSCGDRTLTYTELNARANRLAHALLGRGVGAGSLVGVCLQRSEQMLVALLAVLKSGAAYLPLDPNYPRERLRYILEDTGSRLVLSEDEVLPLLPEFAGEALSLDALAETLKALPASDPALPADPHALAYVLHTSGSTGKPKGVEITQRNLVNFLCSMQREPGLTAADTLLAVTTLSFDISGLEFYLPLLTGARVVMATRDQAMEALELIELMKRWRVSVMQATPATWLMLFEAGWKGDPRLKVLCGGEALPQELAQRLAASCGELWNMYGPTETTIWSAVARIEAGPRSKVTIGHAIGNTTLHVLDENRRPVPAGVLGELYIGGESVARGYWNRPELTAERFVQDPFAPAASARMFRTGDLCRRLSDGRIEYVGRADHQVKIRGFRIELGEMEAVLGSQPAVQQCVVMAREDTPGALRLVAYVVADPNYKPESAAAETAQTEAEQVARWAAAWDDSYREGGFADATFNLSGWNSSYTGQPIPPEQMRAWVDATVARILARGARRVWEIGCGTGLLLFRVAPSTELYQGTDVSPAAIASIGELVQRPEIDLPQVRVLQRAAHEAAPEAGAQAFDLVVINSVAQYFPDAGYLAQVLNGAIAAVAEQGSLFIGDVRNETLLELFRMSVELHNAPSALPRLQLLQRLDKAVRQEAELVVAPEFFLALQRTNPRISRVEIQLKRGTDHNELTCFRYDVVLHLDSARPAAGPVEWHDWTAEGLTPERLHGLLKETKPELLALTRIPDERLQTDAAAMTLLLQETGPANAGELRRAAAAVRGAAVNPERIWQAAAGLPYQLEVRPSHAGADGLFDVLLVRSGMEFPAVRFPGDSLLTRPWQAYCNNPLQQSLARALVPQLRAWIAERLPEYMMPSAMVVLDAMPLSANGKVNRRALPPPEFSREDHAPYLPPQTVYEVQLAAIWAEALHLPQIGLADDFFALGGHSLLGTQVVSRIRKAFAIELPLRALFETPTLAGLAATVERVCEQQDGGTRIAELRVGIRPDRLPLSFAQQRFWFLDQLEPGNAFYNMPVRWRVRGALDLAAVQAAVTEIVARHETLRTTFALRGGDPVQVISPAKPVTVALIDLVDAPNAEDRARALVSAEVTRPFDLERGPIFRATVLRLAHDNHVLVLNAHHIATDGWSSAILRQEFFTLYGAFAAGAPSPLPALPLQYADFALWQRTHLDHALTAQMDFWRNYLDGAPPLIDLPTDKPRPAVQTYRGASHAVLMPQSLLDGLKTLGQQQGATLFMTLLAAFNVLLARYAGQLDLVVGTAIAGRNHSETETLIGLFVNTLALRNDLSGNPTFTELLARVRATTVAAYANQDLPFERLVEELNPVRDSSRSPLYQVMLVLQNTPVDATSVAGLEVTGYGASSESSKLDLVLSVAEVSAGLRASMLFNTDLFDRSTIEQMMRHFQHLLGELTRAPGVGIAHVSLLPQADRDLLLYGLNDTTTDFPLAAMHTLFERQVDRNPAAPALRYGEDTMSYGELDELANRFAHAMIAGGVHLGQVVGVCLERSFDMIVVLLGLFKAGAAYLPLDPSYPDERLAMMLEDGAVELVIAQQATQHKVPSGARTVLVDHGSWRNQRGHRPGLAVELASPAVVIHTSGSTGRPKGAVLHHGGLANFMFSMQQIYPLRAEDRFLLKTSLNFDASMWEIFWALVFGAQVVIAPPDRYLDLEQLVELMAVQRVTFAFMVPSLLSAWLAVPELGRLSGTLRCMLSGGEKVTLPLIAEFKRRLAGVELYQVYGPTETTITVAVWACRLDYPYGVAPLGGPFPNTRFYIVDEHLQPVPHGVAGELLIAGAGVGLGYLNQPGISDERFLTDPFTGLDRAYRTGDRVRYLPDHQLMFLDRLDFQIKLRGLRIELHEIEAALRTHTGLIECVVIAREDDAGEKRIAAYFVPAAGAVLNADELRRHLRTTLPDYMVPAAFVPLAALPLSLNGKVNRLALPPPDFVSSSVSAGHAPVTALQVQIAGIWKDMLHLSFINLEDDFFRMGGHSLLATRMVSRVRAECGVELPLIRIFTHPTLEAFANAVAQAAGGAMRAELRAGVRPQRLPLSFAQQRFWFLDQLEPGSSFYNVSVKWRVRGALDLRAVQAAVTEIVARHETLRTTFKVVEGETLQVIHPAAAVFPVTLQDLSGEPEAQARALVSAEAAQSFDLEHGPLFRALVVRLAEDDHVLCLVTHHIATDGWSSAILRQEFFTLYQAFAAGEPSSLPALPLQYADFALWQRTHLDHALTAQVDYWRTHLAGAPPSIDLPTDKPRPAVQTYRGASHGLLLPMALLEGLKALGQQEGATLFMTLLAAFNVLLARYAGQQDIVVGTAIAGRTHSETEKLIGLFVNTLALRNDLSGNPTFTELLARVRATTVVAYANQDLPFERLVEELNPVRDSSRSPLYQVMLVLQNTPADHTSVAGLEVSGFGAGTETSQMDLLLNLVETPTGLAAALRFNTDLFEAATIARMMTHYMRLLQQMVAAPNAAVASYSLIDDAEREALLSLSRGPVLLSTEPCLHGFFERQAGLTPDAIALVAGTDKLTYRELDRRANQVAHLLKRRGALPDDLVGLFCHRGLDLLVGMLGILKAGCAYVPLDPIYPPERIAAILEDARAGIVLTQDALCDQLPVFTGETLCLDSGRALFEQQPVDRPSVAVGPANLAYVLFTSGSTGRPKGVALEHRSAATFVQWALSVYSPEELAGVLFSTSVCFDLSIFEIFVPLSAGGTILIAENALYLPEMQARDQVTLINTVPSAIAELMRNRAIPASVRTINLAGEALPQDLVDGIYAGTHASKVYNLYGPTEDTTYSTFMLLEPGTPVTIGRPLPNTQALILDQQQQLLPLCVAGELYLAGEGLARGYYARPDLTAERFVLNPFSPTAGARMYRTGDRCRLLPDGTLQYLGRLDYQVKLRGFRIELGEIEAALLRLEGMRQAVVLDREDTPGDRRLVAYLVAAPQPDAAALRLLLQESLPGYMVPAAFVLLDRMPLTPNGKIDRRALPAPVQALPTLATTALSTPLQLEIAQIWSDLLKVPTVNAEDDFFRLGGHSLLATQMVSRVRRAFKVELPLIAIFSHTTLAAFAGAVERALAADSGTARVPSGLGRPVVLPLSYAQQRLWFLDQLEPGNAFYNVTIRWRLRGVLEVSALEAALSEVVARHEVLRTTFTLIEGNPAQIVAPARPVPLPVTDLSAEPDPEAAARSVAGAEARRPFDLRRGPLFRATLLQLSQSDHVLVLNAHHTVTDGWSTGVLRQELSVLYACFVDGLPSPLPPLPQQYADYALWQRETLEGAVLEAQLDYWRGQLQGAPPAIELPTDRPRPALQTYRGDSRRLLLPAELAVELKSLGRKTGATLFMTLLAGFNLLLARYSGQQDLVVGTAIAGRTQGDTEKMIGLFVNSLPLRNTVDPQESFVEVLARFRESTVQAYANQDVPFERLVEELKPVRDSSRNPLYQVMMVLQNTPIQPAKLVGLETLPFGGPLESSKMDLALMLSEDKAGIAANLIFNTDLYDGASAERMLLHFQRVLEAAVREPELPVGRISLLNAAEQALLLALSSGPTLLPSEPCLHNFFERQAALTPDAIAAIAGTERISYRELDHRANQVAHLLRRQGAAPDDLIGLFCHRGLDLLVGMLGILKAGCAYVPLDPIYPPERIAAILEDAHAAIVLTQRALSGQLPGFAGETLCLNADRALFEQEPTYAPNVAVRPANLAYVLFTSGSTGRPKGVALEHRSAAIFVQWALSVYSPAELAGMLWSTSVCFDLSIFEIFVPLAAGGTVIVAENALHLPVLAARNQVTLINTVPSAMAELVRNHAVPPSVRTINLAGEALPQNLVERIYAATHAGRVYNLYGPTEDTTYSTFTLVTPGTPVTIGLPLPNTQALILDDAGQLLPIGVPGELYLAGEGLARGYYARPDLTAERFLPNPFSTAADARMYRTGDRCRRLPDGTLQYLGRLDYQVKLRGFRIELGEIEAALVRQPEVSEVAVLLREDIPGDRRLVAYLTADITLDHAEWRARLKLTLPDYMVPSTFVALDRMPLTQNGKIDRKALPAPQLERLSHAPGRLPQTRMELLLAAIWMEILHLPSVQAEDDFFLLGGHSLLAAAMMGRLSEALGYNVRLAVLFGATTLAALAEIAERQGITESTLSTLVPIRRAGTKPPLFCVSRPNVNALGFLFLSRAISTDFPIFGLQTTMDHDGVIAPFQQQDYEDKAREYILSMREVQPEGPYFLAGFCEGAHIAFEMARQLEAVGLEVGAVFILDVWPIENTISRTRFKLRGYGRVLRHFGKATNSERLTMLTRRLNHRSAIAPKLDPFSQRLNRDPDVDTEARRAMTAISASRYWPGKDFKPTIFDGNMVVFRIRKQPFHRIKDESLGWRSRVRGKVDIVYVPGQHSLILRDPAVSVVARELEAYINAYVAEHAKH